VTVDNVRHRLSDSFFVIATQNPVEHHGTYPLPEAQLDRFALKLSIGYPDPADERALLAAAIRRGESAPTATVQALMPRQLAVLQDAVETVEVAGHVQAYLVDLARATRSRPDVPLGLSPRGVLTWQRVAQAWAFLAGRSFVTPDDLRTVAGPVLGVRLQTERPIVAELFDSVAVPIHPK
jgi:MoxR-like ATPase